MKREIETKGTLLKSIPAGTAYIVHINGVVQIGNMTVTPSDFDKMQKDVLADRNYQDNFVIAPEESLVKKGKSVPKPAVL